MEWIHGWHKERGNAVVPMLVNLLYERQIYVWQSVHCTKNNAINEFKRLTALDSDLRLKCSNRNHPTTIFNHGIILATNE